MVLRSEQAKPSSSILNGGRHYHSKQATSTSLSPKRNASTNGTSNKASCYQNGGDVSAKSSPSPPPPPPQDRRPAMPDTPTRASMRLIRTESSNMLSTAVYVKDDRYGWRPAELYSQSHSSHHNHHHHNEGGSGRGPAVASPKAKPDPNVAHVVLTSHPAVEYTESYYTANHTADNINSSKRSGALAKAKKSYGSVRSSSSMALEEDEDLNHKASHWHHQHKSTVVEPSETDIETSINAAGSKEKNTITVKLSDYESGALPLQDVDSTGDLVIRDDLSDMPFLHEASILYNLATRHGLGTPYTRAGVVIVAMNPFKWINGLYSVNKRKQYADHYVWNPQDPWSASAIKLDPHVYEASALAYRGLIIDGTDQSILVSGETGAGKTETVKILMSHLATFDATKPVVEERVEAAPPPSVFHTPATAQEDEEKALKESIFRYPMRLKRRLSHRIFKSKRSPKAEEKPAPAVTEEEQEPEMELKESVEKLLQSSSRYLLNVTEVNNIVQRVIDSNPLLEAFGNAKTSRNDNSSRFSKYTKLQFHLQYIGSATPSCKLAGSVCQTFLLEKSRVVNHETDLGERTFHIFYQLLAAPEEYKANLWSAGLSGADASSFKYVGAPSTDVIEGMTDSERWKEVYAALHLVGISGDRLLTFLRAICIVLQLGNLIFEKDPNNEDGSVITSKDELEKFSDILGVPSNEIETCLTYRTMVTTRETYMVPLNSTIAKETCDAFAKEIYARTFHWLVRAINEATCAEKNFDEEPKPENFGTIGLLDIFGFESFEINHFEQLCINHANERLQKKFTEDIFQSVHEEYETEGIDLRIVDFEDNSKIISLFEGRLGLIDILNEECLRPQGSDTGFVNKIYANNRKPDSPLYQKRGFQRHEFGVRHYAGPVKYDASKIVMKNNDALPHDVILCAAQSSNSLIEAEFKPMAEALKGKTSTLVHETVWSKFRSQLTSLMDDIGKTTTRYVRCIVPNREKKELVTDLRYTVTQLHYAGILSAVTMSRAAFPNRMEIETVLDRFTILRNAVIKLEERKEKAAHPSQEVCDMLDALLKNSDVLDEDEEKEPFACGKTKVYFRTGVLEYLEAKRLLAFGIMATKIQCLVRQRTAIKRFKQLKLEHQLKLNQLRAMQLAQMKSGRRSVKFSRIRRKLFFIGFLMRRRKGLF